MFVHVEQKLCIYSYKTKRSVAPGTHAIPRCYCSVLFVVQLQTSEQQSDIDNVTVSHVISQLHTFFGKFDLLQRLLSRFIGNNYFLTLMTGPLLVRAYFF